MKSMNWVVAVLIALVAWGCCDNCRGAETGAAETAALLANNAANAAQAIEATTANTKEIIGSITSSSGVIATAVSSAGSVVSNVVAKAPGWGDEFAAAIAGAGKAFVQTADGTLTVTQDQLMRFVNSDAGKFTMFAIAWKLFAKDFIEVGHVFMGYLVGGLLIIFGTMAIWRANSRLTTGYMSVTEQKGWWIFSIKTKTFQPSTIKSEDKTSIYVGSILATLIIIGIGLAVMF